MLKHHKKNVEIGPAPRSKAAKHYYIFHSLFNMADMPKKMGILALFLKKNENFFSSWKKSEDLICLEKRRVNQYFTFTNLTYRMGKFGGFYDFNGYTEIPLLPINETSERSDHFFEEVDKLLNELEKKFDFKNSFGNFRRYCLKGMDEKKTIPRFGFKWMLETSVSEKLGLCSKQEFYYD